MNNEELKSRLGGNIARLRKVQGMTQADLAQRLNYSDKAVSKWERGESMPDILTLVQLAEELETDVNELLSDPNAPASPAQVSQPEHSGDKARQKPKANRRVIQQLSSVLVWMVALFFYLVLDSFGVSHVWLVLVLGVLGNAITLLSLRSAWRLYGWNRILISVIMWTALAFVWLLFFLVWSVNVWRIFLLGALGQAAIVLWLKMFQRQEDSNE